MKARVKATGALLIVRPYDGSDFDWICDMDGETGTLWKTDELEFIDDFEPDYWEKLKHQYAGMAMQGLLSNSAYLENFIKYCAKDGDHLARVVSRNAIDYATILIDKLKEESHE